MILNKIQTQITDEFVKKLDSYVKEELFDSIDRIEFIKQLISPHRKYAKDKKRWDRPYSKNRIEDPNGKIAVDMENPHILEDMDFFKPSAIYFEKHGVYTNHYPSKHPNSEFKKFWNEEKRRCKEGYVRPYDGEWITGYNYYYWNYSPIMIAEAKHKDDLTAVELDDLASDFDTITADRIEGFPHIWDMDYFYYHYLEQTEQNGKYGAVLKTRGRGYSFKGGSLLGRNYNFYPISKSWAFASDKGDLLDDGLLSKAWDNLNFINEHTPWYKRRQEKNTDMHKRASYLDLKRNTSKGYKSEIIGLTTANKPEKARGKRGKCILLEEAGRYLNLLTVWSIARPSMEQGSLVFGLMVAFGTGGCLTAGNKVWNNKGDFVNIEDLNVEDGIIGYDQNDKRVSFETISYYQEPTFKECVLIRTNTGRTIECSLDHPLFTTICSRDSKKNNFFFKEAKDFTVGDKLAIADEVFIFGSKKMWNPYLIGLLIGDGSYPYNGGVTLSNADKDVQNYVKSNFKYNVLCSRPTKDNRTYQEISIKNIRSELRKLGIVNQTGLNKTLPKNVHQYSKKDIVELLAGFYDADGYVNIRKNKKRNTFIGEISLSSTSEDLLNEVRFLLQKFGIHGTMRKRLPRLNKTSKIKDVNPWFEFIIADTRSLLKFADNITLKVKNKQNRLLKIKKIFSNVNPHSIDEGVRLEKVSNIKYTGLQRVYNLTADNTNTYLGNGIITHNTTGAAFEGLEALFYTGGAYRVNMINNIFDKTRGQGQCAFYCGEYMNREGCYDENGNSDVIKALIEIFYSRLEVIKSNPDPKTIIQEKADRSITPQEAVMRTEGTIFPISDLKDYLSDIKPREDTFVSPHYVGRLSLKEGNVKWQLDHSTQPIRKFSFGSRKQADKTGALEIFKMPVLTNSGKIPHYRYIGGIDPYDDDTGTSLGSIFIFDLWTDTVVAEYTGRPKFANDFYEICRRLGIFYNATLNYENKNKGLFGYFSNKHSLHLLADNPQFLKDTDLSSNKESYGNKKKGTAPTKEVNALGRRLQRDWMLTDHETEEGTILKLQTIRSIAYLEEAIAWNPDGNFDRISSMGMVMILREEFTKYKDTMMNPSSNKTLAEDPFWKKN